FSAKPFPNAESDPQVSLHDYLHFGSVYMKLKPIAELALLVLVTAAPLNGCGTSMWSHRDTNPSIQDQIYTTNWWVRMFGDTNSVNTFATTASRRVVIVS